MSKYYVQSGTMRSIVQAESSRRAALWAVHQAMQQVLPMEDSPEEFTQSLSVSKTGKDHASVAVLSRTVHVSEQGFDRTDAKSMPTLEIINEWNELVMTLDRLERMLHLAG